MGSRVKDAPYLSGLCSKSVETHPQLVQQSKYTYSQPQMVEIGQHAREELLLLLIRIHVLRFLQGVDTVGLHALSAAAGQDFLDIDSRQLRLEFQHDCRLVGSTAYSK